MTEDDLLNQPVTTPCGHTMCKRCLVETLVRKQECPLCTEKCYLNELKVNVLLQSLIEKAYPEKAKERAEQLRLDEEAKKLQERMHDNLTLPAFEYKVHVLPNTREMLHFFEPRYKDLV